MSQKFVYILDLDILYSTLIEIKDELDFQIIKIHNINEFDKIFKKKNFILISNKEKNLYQKRFGNRSLCLINYPISIQNIIDKINIQFLKANYESQSVLRVGKYNLNFNTRYIILNNKKLKLTEKEITLIRFLFFSKKPITIKELKKEIWKYNEQMETHTVETHIYRLRKKISSYFNDQQFLISSKQGYFIYQYPR